MKKVSKILLTSFIGIGVVATSIGLGIGLGNKSHSNSKESNFKIESNFNSKLISNDKNKLEKYNENLNKDLENVKKDYVELKKLFNNLNEKADKTELLKIAKELSEIEKKIGINSNIDVNVLTKLNDDNEKLKELLNTKLNDVNRIYEEKINTLNDASTNIQNIINNFNTSTESKETKLNEVLLKVETYNTKLSNSIENINNKHTLINNILEEVKATKISIDETVNRLESLVNQPLPDSVLKNDNGDINANNNKITNINDPQNDKDAANKKYVDDRLRELEERINNRPTPETLNERVSLTSAIEDEIEKIIIREENIKEYYKAQLETKKTKIKNTNSNQELEDLKEEVTFLNSEINTPYKEVKDAMQNEEVVNTMLSRFIEKQQFESQLPNLKTDEPLENKKQIISNQLKPKIVDLKTSKDIIEEKIVPNKITLESGYINNINLNSLSTLNSNLSDFNDLWYKVDRQFKEIKPVIDKWLLYGMKHLPEESQNRLRRGHIETLLLGNIKEYDWWTYNIEHNDSLKPINDNNIRILNEINTVFNKLLDNTYPKDFWDDLGVWNDVVYSNKSYIEDISDLIEEIDTLKQNQNFTNKYDDLNFFFNGISERVRKITKTSSNNIQKDKIGIRMKYYDKKITLYFLKNNFSLSNDKFYLSKKMYYDLINVKKIVFEKLNKSNLFWNTIKDTIHNLTKNDIYIKGILYTQINSIIKLKMYKDNGLFSNKIFDNIDYWYDILNRNLVQKNSNDLNDEKLSEFENWYNNYYDDIKEINEFLTKREDILRSIENLYTFVYNFKTTNIFNSVNRELKDDILNIEKLFTEKLKTLNLNSEELNYYESFFNELKNITYNNFKILNQKLINLDERTFYNLFINNYQSNINTSIQFYETNIEELLQNTTNENMVSNLSEENKSKIVNSYIFKSNYNQLINTTFNDNKLKSLLKYNNLDVLLDNLKYKYEYFKNNNFELRLYNEYSSDINLFYNYFDLNFFFTEKKSKEIFLNDVVFNSQTLSRINSQNRYNINLPDNITLQLRYENFTNSKVSNPLNLSNFNWLDVIKQENTVLSQLYTTYKQHVWDTIIKPEMILMLEKLFKKYSTFITDDSQLNSYYERRNDLTDTEMIELRKYLIKKVWIQEKIPRN